MKKIWAVSLVFVIALAIVALTACEPKGPKALVAETTFNFGQIDQYDVAAHVFIIKNQGDQKLEIKRVKSTCGCTAAQPKSKVIEPGQQTEIEVKFDAGPRSGEQKKRITVETNDAATPVIQLYMEGTVVERLALDPRSIRIIDAEPNKEASGTLTMTNKSQQAITISALKADDPTVTKTVLKVNDKPAALPYKLEPGQSVVLSVTVKMPADKNFHRTSMQVITAERPDKPVTVNIVLRKKGAGGVQPGQFLPNNMMRHIPAGGPTSSMHPGIKPKSPKKPAPPTGDE